MATIITIEGIMTRRTIEQRLAQLEAQKKTLQARLGKQDRARDTRRKVLLGALVLHRLQTDMPDTSTAWLRAWLSSELPAFLTRDSDKTLLADVMAGDALPTSGASHDLSADMPAPKLALEPAQFSAPSRRRAPHVSSLSDGDDRQLISVGPQVAMVSLLGPARSLTVDC